MIGLLIYFDIVIMGTILMCAIISFHTSKTNQTNNTAEGNNIESTTSTSQQQEHLQQNPDEHPNVPLLTWFEILELNEACMEYYKRQIDNNNIDDSYSFIYHYNEIQVRSLAHFHDILLPEFSLSKLKKYLDIIYFYKIIDPSRVENINNSYTFYNSQEEDLSNYLDALQRLRVLRED